MKNIFETIKQIAETKKEQKRAINQIVIYETEWKIQKLTDKLVAQYIDQCTKESEEPDDNTIIDLAEEAFVKYSETMPSSDTPYRYFSDGFNAGYIKAKELK